MPPWTRKVISTQLDKVTVKNHDEVAQKIVKELDTRSLVQHLAVLVVRQANKWYAHSFHEQHDVQKRNLCDNFVGSLLHALALRIKPIKDVPTPEGLSGIPLLKADLLSVWIYRHMSIGPIAAALFNSGNLSVDDLRVVIRACLETAYTANVRNIGDALLLLELGGRQLDAEDSSSFVNFLKSVKVMLRRKRARSSQRVKIGDRLVPSLLDRYDLLAAQYRKGWHISPYNSATQSESIREPVEASQAHGDEPATETNVQDGRSSITHRSRSSSTSTFDDDDEEEAHTDTLHDEADTAQDDRFSSSHETELTNHAVWSDGKAHHGFEPVSPWNAYFAQVMNESHTEAVGRRTRPRTLNIAEQTREDVETVDDQDAEAEASRSSRQPSMYSASSTGSSVRQSSLYAARAQMEIMKRHFPVELMRRPAEYVAAEHVKGRSVKPSHSQALGLHTLVQGDQSNTARRRVNSEVQAAHVHATTSSAHLAPPRRASDALTSLPNARPRAAAPPDECCAKAFPASFHGDAIWIQLDRPEPFGIHIRFPSDFRIGDAQRIARHLSEAMKDDDDDIVDSTSLPSDAHPNESILHFTPSGSVVQDLSFGDKSVFVEYSPDMTLAQARHVGQTLSQAASQLAV